MVWSPKLPRDFPVTWSMSATSPWQVAVTRVTGKFRGSQRIMVIATDCCNRLLWLYGCSDWLDAAILSVCLAYIYRFFMRCICRFLVATSAAVDDVSIIGGAADWQGTAHNTQWVIRLISRNYLGATENARKDNARPVSRGGQRQNIRDWSLSHFASVLVCCYLTFSILV